MITIITVSGAYRFKNTSWARDDGRDVHVYDGNRTIASFDADQFVATFQNLSDEQHEALVEKHDVDDVGVIDPNATTTTTAEP